MAQSSSQYENFKQNNLRIGDTAPDFDVGTSTGKINFYNYLGNSWGLLVSHPRDFTPVCTTELGRLAKLKPKFTERNVKVIALSVDTAEHHQQWIKDINEVNSCTVDYPIIEDTDRRISCLYGMLDQTLLTDTGLPLTVRSVFVIGPDKKIKAMIIYPASTGRNFDEIIRLIDSLQLALSHKVATPVDWKKGEDCVVLPSIPTEEARKIFPKGVKEVRTWLRTTPDPSA